MKTLIKTVIVLLLAMPLQAQKINVKTYSVVLEDLINFVAENYEYQDPEDESAESHNIVFLIQVANEDMLVEDLIILKQSFKMIAQRLNDYNSISILTYFGYNGVAMEHSLPSEVDKVYSTLSDLKSHISKFGEDGIEMAYNYINKTYDEAATNTIIIIRNNNASKTKTIALTKKDIKKIKRKQKKKEILKVAVSLVPEIIAILKN